MELDTWRVTRQVSTGACSQTSVNQCVKTMAEQANVASETNAENREEQTRTITEKLNSTARDVGGRMQEWRQSTPKWGEMEQWASNYPGVAILGAVGLGVAAGRWLFSSPSPPPTFSERVEAAAREAADQARWRADEAGEVVARRINETSRTASEQFNETARSAEKAGRNIAGVVRREARENPELARLLTNAAYSVAAALAVKKVSDWVQRD